MAENEEISLKTKLQNILNEKGTKLIPENIKSGTTILGVTGTYSSDATATANDLLSPKAAYSNGQKITGAIIPTYEKGDLQSVEIGNVTTSFDTIDYKHGVASYLQDGKPHFVKIVDGEFDYENELVAESSLWDQAIYQYNGTVLEVPDEYPNKCVICYTVNDNTAQTAQYYRDIKVICYTIDTENWVLITYPLTLGGWRLWLTTSVYAIPNRPGYLALLKTEVNYNSNQTYYTYYILKYDFVNDTISSVATKNVYTADGYRNVRNDLTINSNPDGNILYFYSTTYNVSVIASFSHDYTTSDIIYSSANNSAYKYYPIANDYCFRADGNVYRVDDQTLVGTCPSNLTNGVVIKDTVFYNNNVYKFNSSTFSIELYSTYTGSILVSQQNSYIFFSKNADNIINGWIIGETENIVSLSRMGTIYYSTNGTTASSSDILSTKTAYISTGKVTGSMPNNGALSYNPSVSQQTIPAGYTSGGTINAVTSAIDSNIIAENIKSGITVLGVTGTYDNGVAEALGGEY